MKLKILLQETKTKNIREFQKLWSKEWKEIFAYLILKKCIKSDLTL